MRRIFLFSLALLYLLIFCGNNLFANSNTIHIKLFYSSHCKNCIDIKEEYLPKIISKYKDKIEVEYLNTAQQKNFELLLAAEQSFNIKARVPSILIGDYFLIGPNQIKSQLEPIIKEHILSSNVASTAISKINLKNKFRLFSPMAIIAAGLIDGVNPCAFAVIIFFISFLTLMGYKKKDLAIIGFSFIFAVFLTYLAIGLGLFRGLYELEYFNIFIKSAYVIIAIICFVLAYLNFIDFLQYRKTKSPDALKIKLPSLVRKKINSIIAMFYRKEQTDKSKTMIVLVASAFLVGFLISLLEAVCTGQVYLPTIIFILKEPLLRFKAIFYLLVYNLMFIAPLFLILLVAVLGISSKRIEEFFRNKVAFIKIVMFILFLALGVFLLIGV